MLPWIFFFRVQLRGVQTNEKGAKKLSNELIVGSVSLVRFNLSVSLSKHFPVISALLCSSDLKEI